MIDNLNYRSFPAVSNSDLKAFKDEINGIERVYNEKYLAIG